MRAETPKAILLNDYRPTPYVIDEVHLTFRLRESDTRVLSRLRMRPNKKSKSKSPSLELSGEKIQLLGIRLDGKALASGDFSVTEKALVIGKVPRKAFELEIETACNPKDNTELSGLYMSNGVYCTQCEAEGFRRITYFHDRPDVLARYTVRIEAPQSVPVLLSNGNPTAQGEIAGSDLHFSEWHDPHPKPAYLFALVAGDLAQVEDHFVTMEGNKVRLGIYVEKGKENRCAWAMTSLKAAMHWDEQVFKRAYDLDVFNIVAVSDFNMGAMENKGLNIFNDKYILALPETATDTDYELIEAIIAHEYFHNWTGNRITCRDWFQLCLKEGLTVFRDQEFTSDLRSRAVKRIEDVQDLRASQFPEDAGPLQHPPRPSSYIEINNFYTSTVYEKGAEVCRMMKTLIGDAAFARAMQLYFKRHDGQAATVEQFVACMEQASGRSLKQFFRWYTQAGTPVISIKEKYEPKRRTYTLSLSQKVKRLKGQKRKLPLHIPLRMGLLNAEGKDLPLKSDLLELKKSQQVFTFKNLAERPVLSINRGFSAPVEIKRRAAEGEQLFLLAHDNDALNRWEAGQNVSMQLIISCYDDGESENWHARLGRFAAAFGHVLRDTALDNAFKAKFFDTPDYEELMAALAKNIDAERLRAAHDAFRKGIALACAEQLHEIYNSTSWVGPYMPDAAGVGRRALRHAALDLAAMGGLDWVEKAIRDEFAAASNMTSEHDALQISTECGGVLATDLLHSFYARHRGDNLLIDKWFAAQARVEGADAPARVRALMAHEDFTYKTPNRVYALLRNFVFWNFSGFHSVSGEGYKLIADAIITLDAINPQVASRLATGFRTWRMFDVDRRTHAQAALQRILSTKPLSADVFEIISRTLKA